MAEQEAIGLLEQLARDFNVAGSPQALPDRSAGVPGPRDLTSVRAAAALRSDVARQILAPKPRSLGKSAAEGPNDRLQADLVDFSQNTRGRNKYRLVVQDVFTREIGGFETTSSAFGHTVATGPPSLDTGQAGRVAKSLMSDPRFRAAA